jgi:hypothetical protein
MSFRELIVEVAHDMDDNSLGVYATSSPELRTIFTGEMPDMVKDSSGTDHPIVEGIVLVNVPSPPPHQYVDTEYLVIDFWSRSPHSDRSINLLRQVFNLYNRRYDWDTLNWHIYWSRALGGIVDADRDLDSGKMFRLSIQFLCRNLTNIS